MPEPSDTDATLTGESPLPAVDRGAVRQLEEQLGAEGFAELVTIFLARLPDRLATLREAVAADDASALREAAHSLKGAARGFGAAEMGEIAARIEHEAAAGALERGDELVGAVAASFERTRTELVQQVGGTGGADETTRSIRVLLADDDPVVRGHLTARPPAGAPEPAAARIAELERRVTSLEQSLLGLLARREARKR